MPSRTAAIAAILFALLTLLPSETPSRTAREWQATGWVTDFEQGLERASAAGRLAFVYFDAEWCSWCHQYERETLSRPEVQRALIEGFVPVRVDWDARPDLLHRYGAKGLPFSLLLSAGGEVIHAFVGILAPQDLLDMLDRAEAPAATAQQALAGAIEVQALDRSGFETFRNAYLQHLEALYDHEIKTLAGRFQTGAGLKWPSPKTWSYLLERGLWPDRVQAAAAAEAQRLLDRLDGGFFNYVDPHHTGGQYSETSKLLEGNAWLSAWLAQVGALKRVPYALRAARAGFFFLREVLWDRREGGFWQAQIADADYYRLPRSERLKAKPPPVDRAKRADTNAQAAWALLRIGQFTEDPGAVDLGAKALEYVLSRMLENGVLYHISRDGDNAVPNMPQDWFWVLAAGSEVEAVHPDPTRRKKLATIATEARRWIEQRMAVQGHLPVELAGLIAWVSTTEIGRSRLPPGTAAWALAQLRIEADTRPDDLVLGLIAWERTLGYGGAQENVYGHISPDRALRSQDAGL